MEKELKRDKISNSQELFVVSYARAYALRNRTQPIGCVHPERTPHLLLQTDLLNVLQTELSIHCTLLHSLNVLKLVLVRKFLGKAIHKL